MSSEASLPGTRASRSTFGWARRLGGRLAGLIVVTAIAALVGLLALLVAGYRPLVEQSDSMAPVMYAGDLLFVRQIPASEARQGDILTFDDADRPGQTLTHRVVSAKPDGTGELAFVTRGDANTGEERWTVRPEGIVGRYGFRVPAAGRLSQLATSGLWRALVMLAAVGLAVDLLRRVWRKPPPAG
jgi:signal peptidase